MGQDMKQCPFCGEMIKAAAIKCRYCQSWLNDKPVQTQQLETVKKEDIVQRDQTEKQTQELEDVMVSVSPPFHSQSEIEINERPHVALPKYEIKIEDEVKGPFDVSELREKGLTADVEVRVHGSENWLPAWADKNTSSLFSKDEIRQVKPRMFAHPFSYKGRIRRKEYCWSHVIVIVVGLILHFLVQAVPYLFTVIMALILTFPLLWFITAQGSKRCHDYGESGWKQFNCLLPAFIGAGLIALAVNLGKSLPFYIHIIIIAILLSLVIFGCYWSIKDMFIEEGMAYTNTYGPDPKAGLCHDTDEQSERYRKRFIITLGSIVFVYMALSLLYTFTQNDFSDSSTYYNDNTLTTAPTVDESLDSQPTDETPSQEDALDNTTASNGEQVYNEGDAGDEDGPVIHCGVIQGPLGRMNVRSSPSKADDSNIIDKWENGTEVYYWHPEDESDWVIVRKDYDGPDIGYMSVKGIKFVSL